MYMKKKAADSIILIVDDAPENLSILSDLLSTYRIKVATNGILALKIANLPEPPDLILLDIMMPGMDGYEVCDELKSSSHTAEIPVIFITSLNSPESIIKGFDAGAVDYIVKPFNRDEVLRRVNLHLSLNLYRKELEGMNAQLEYLVEKRTEELVVAKEKAEESNRLKSHFLSLISHEIRTPMMGIMGFSQILLEEIEDKVLKDYANDLFCASNRLKDTLEAILNISRLESNKLHLEISEFDIIEKIKLLADNHIIKAKAKGLVLSTEFESDSSVTRIDEAKFEIIFNNIVDNAIKYTKSGKVEIKYSTVTEKGNEFHKIVVADTGIGIPENMHERIFDEFRQVDEGLGRNFQGVGLGLSLVRKFVLAMQGKIKLNSSPGNGAEFTVYLPCHLSIGNVVPPKTEEQIAEPVVPDKKIKLLMIEDDDFNVKVNSVSLRDFCEISVAKNSDEAFELAENSTFDCVLMDINLGKGLSGIEITKQLRKQQKYNQIPIIAFTAYALDGDKENFLEIGCSHYLAKPSNLERLREVVIKSLI